MKTKVFNSRRGDYVVWPEFADNKFTLETLESYINEFKGIERIKELATKEYYLMKDYTMSIGIAQGIAYSELKAHPFWAKETDKLLKSYLELYGNFHRLMKNPIYGSKNLFSIHKDTCISSLQLTWDNEGTPVLNVYQRSCDLSLGYLADAITLLLFMKDYNIKKLKWTIGCPHVYTNNLEKTEEQFKTKTKIKMNFNVR